MEDDHVAAIPHTRGRATREELAAELRALPGLSVRTASTPSATVQALEAADILVTMGFEDAWYDHLDGIVWVQFLSAGVDHVDVGQLRDRNVVVTNASGVHAVPIAEQVLGYMLMFARNLHTAIRQQHRGVWERFSGGELAGGTVGIVGVGAIGDAVAERCGDLGMHVAGTKRDPSTGADHVDDVYGADDLEEVLAVAEYLVVACPLTEDTRGLIDRDALRVLPDDAVVINIARGAVIEEADLVRALQQGRIRGAALDVFEDEPLPASSTLWDLSNVVITPHMAGSTPRYWERCGEVFARNYERFAAGEPERMPTRVD